MESERGRGQPELLADLTGRQPIFAGLNQQPVNVETSLLREAGQGRKSF